MVFWLLISALTLAACLAVLWPFLRSPRVSNPEGQDVEVYRDQLAEIDRDAARGLVGAPEAEEARVEIARRLLRAADRRQSSTPARGDRLARIVVTAAIILVPIASWTVYVAVGSPGLPDQPLAERLARSPAASGVEELVARAELHLNENPQDGRGWDVLAPVYLRVGRNADAVIAFRNAIRLQGPTAAREGGLGEALVAASGGTVNEEAHEAFSRALALESGNARARFFVALADAQEGKVEAARAGWQALEIDLPQDSPWRATVQQALARLPGQGKDAAPRGPTQDDVAAAAAMDPQQRNEMIEGMVARLDQRLQENPADADGWRRLLQSYLVLGKPQDAARALARGVEALGMGTREASALVEFADGLGVKAEAIR